MPTQPNVSLSVRISPQLEKAMEDQARRLGMSKTEAVKAAIQSWLEATTRTERISSWLKDQS